MNEDLLALVERIENITAEIEGLTDDRKDIFAEAKAKGYDVPTIRKIVAERAIERNLLKTKVALLDTYRAAVGIEV